MNERASERELLFHSPGKAIRQSRAEAFEIEPLEQLLPARRPIPSVMSAREEGDVLIDRKISVDGESLGTTLIELERH